MGEVSDERSLSAVIGDLTRDLGVLLRTEVALARVEIGQKLTSAARYGAMLATGAVVGVTGLFALVAFLVLALVAAGMPGWGAALLVGLGLCASGALLVMRGLTALRTHELKPAATLETMKENAAWARRRIASSQ